MKKPSFALFSIILFLISCGGASEQTTEESAPEATEIELSTATEEIKEVEVKLKGVYATSTKLPQTQFGYENLFDGDEATVWSTMTGAGPDEGVMLYFDPPQAISELEIINAGGNEYSKVTSVKVYVNGQSPLTRVTSDKIAINKDEVKSLYIRMEGLSDLEQIDKQGEYGEFISSTTFPSAKSAGISMLVLYSDGNKLKLIAPNKIEGSVTASTTLKPKVSYGARNLFDGRKEFAWVEGAKGNGEGQTLTFSLKKEIELSGVIIANGFQRSDTHFNSNARLKSFTVTNEKGESRVLNFKDIQGEQQTLLSTPIKGKEFTFTITEAYAGSKYKDLVISEMKLMDNGNMLVLMDEETPKIITNLLKKTQNTVLQNYVDKQVFFRVSEMGSFERSIILRSDYTFVVYQYNSEDGASEEIIADGNWEIKELETNRAKIRVFGKFARTSTTYNPYAGNAEESQVKIFQDYLEVTNEGIKGNKFIPEIKRMVDNGE